jgi:O-antigen/teichoic acid export membrane protein
VARENIVYTSIVDVLDGVLKFIIAICLSRIAYDHLIAYSSLLVGIALFNLLAFGIYAAAKYSEFHLPRLRELDWQYVKGLSYFAGWTVYSTGCVIARNQGLSVVLNLFYGTLVNSAYGIAQQVSGAVQFLSASIVSAMNPQIMKAEGGNNRERMVMLSEYMSKYSFLLLALVAIPIIAEMDTLLQLWLGEVPEHTSMFCKLMLVASLCDQLSVGLTSANQAIGNIKKYTLIFYTTKLLVIIAGWICLYKGLPIASIMWCYVVIELMTSLMRLPLMKWIAGIAIIPFCKHVFGKIILPMTAMIAVCYIMTNYIQFGYRVLLTIGASVLVGIMMIWLTALDKKEKDLIKQSIKGIIRK